MKSVEMRENWLGKELLKKLENIIFIVKNETGSESSLNELPFYTPHGVKHLEGVETRIYQLLYKSFTHKKHKKEFKSPKNHLTENERFFLIGSAWLHDLGMIRDLFGDEDNIDANTIRESHHLRSERYISEKFLKLGITEEEYPVFSTLAHYHRRKTNLNDCPESMYIINHGTIRVRLLAAYLRLADALHMDSTRAPSNLYAITLAYNIPSSSKIHWLKSIFVLGIKVDSIKKEIVLQFKYPRKILSETVPRTKDAYEKALKGIYSLIVSDLTDELNTVRHVLIKEGLSYFLDIKTETIVTHIKESIYRDISTVLNYYFIMDNPSSSALCKLIIQSIQSIYSANESNPETTAQKFIEEVEENILNSRECHTGLKNLIQSLKSKIKSLIYTNEELLSWLNCQLEKLENERRLIRNVAKQFFKEKAKEDKEKIDFKNNLPNFLALEYIFEVLGYKNLNKLESLDPVLRDFLIYLKNSLAQKCYRILLYGVSELVINTLFGLRDFIFAELLCAIKDICDDEKNIEQSFVASKFAYNIKIEFLEKWLNEKIKETDFCLYYEELFSNNNDYEKNDSCKKNNLKDKKNITIHLKTKIKEELVKNNKNKCIFLHTDIEKRASEFIEIFVCEGQPKNKTDWNGRVLYNDGQQYSIALAEKEFLNIRLIPDAIVASLLHFNKKNKDEEKGFESLIDYVILGTNGFNKEYFKHSAGHKMIAHLVKTSSAKLILALLASKYSSDEKLTKNTYFKRIKSIITQEPKLPSNKLIKEVKSIFTEKENPSDDKLMEEIKNKHINSDFIKEIVTKILLNRKIDDSEKINKLKILGFKDNFKKDLKKPISNIISVNNWKFRTDLSYEKTRNNVFIAQDSKIEGNLTEEFSSIALYNSREDSIDFKMVDYVISEAKYFSKDGNGKSPEEWNGQKLAEDIKEFFKNYSAINQDKNQVQNKKNNLKNNSTKNSNINQDSTKNKESSFKKDSTK